jgi:hypothetical protein
MFLGRVEKPVCRNKEFRSLLYGRAIKNAMLTKKNLILTFSYDWEQYEGEFDFTYFCKSEVGDCLDHSKELLQMLKTKIQRTFPNEPFELEERGGSQRDLFVKIKCNRSLKNSIEQYFFCKTNWEDYKVSISSYWRK